MLILIYLFGFCFVLYTVVIRYDDLTLKRGGYKQTYSPWMADLVNAIIMALWPLLLLRLIWICYRDFQQMQIESRRKK